MKSLRRSWSKYSKKGAERKKDRSPNRGTGSEFGATRIPADALSSAVDVNAIAGELPPLSAETPKLPVTRNRTNPAGSVGTSAFIPLPRNSLFTQSLGFIKLTAPA